MNPESDFGDIGFPPPGLDAAGAALRLKRCGEMGLMRHVVPECYGGSGVGYLALCESHERLGLATCDPGLILALNAHLWGGVFSVLHFASERLKAALLPSLAEGRWIAGHAITEPNAGSDVQGMAATAEKVEGGYRLNGLKRYITNAPVADWLVVYARLGAGLCAFLVHRDDPGASFTEGPAVAACGGGTLGDVVLADCRVADERLLGKPGAGAMMLQAALEHERAFIFAGIVGVMAWQLGQVVAFSRSRRSGTGHLGRHQAVSHRIAEMKLRLDTSRLWVHECARLADAGQRIALPSAETKLFAAEAFLQSSLDAVHILGARGLEEDQPMARLVQDALAGRLFSGSSEIQRNIIAALLGTGDGYRSGARGG